MYLLILLWSSMGSLLVDFFFSPADQVMPLQKV